MKKFGLIGFPLTHSFSKKYFSEKFEKENITGCSYNNYEIENINDFEELIQNQDNLKGINVTIPHKQNVIPFLDDIHEAAEKIGAVNVIKFNEDRTLTGYNSDYYGFKNSLVKMLDGVQIAKALVLGTGGASKAVCVALEDLGILPQYVSRTASEGVLSYDDLSESVLNDHQLIVNCSPVGTYPKVDECPNIPYEYLTASHYLYDLVYNPEETLFMKNGLEQKSKVCNGYQMLVLQAEKAWEIWNEN